MGWVTGTRWVGGGRRGGLGGRDLVMKGPARSGGFQRQTENHLRLFGRPSSTLPAVSLLWLGYNKLLQTWWFKTTDIYSVMGLETRSLKSVPQGWNPGVSRPCSLRRRWGICSSLPPVSAGCWPSLTRGCLPLRSHCFLLFFCVKSPCDSTSSGHL